jgi:hypothetical protein
VKDETTIDGIRKDSQPKQNAKGAMNAKGVNTHRFTHSMHCLQKREGKEARRAEKEKSLALHRKAGGQHDDRCPPFRLGD